MRQFVLALIAASAALAQNTGLVEGRLTNSVTHQGIDGARVTLTALIARAEYDVRTGADGAFRVENLPRGEYLSRFQVEGFMDLAPGHPALRVFSVIPDRDPIRFDVEFIPLGKLSGRVVDPSGQPLAGASVQLFYRNFGSGSVARSGKNGEFEFRTLIPGKYTLMAAAKAPATPDVGEPKTWAPTFYPDRLEPEDAESVTVRPATDLSGYTIRIRAVPVQKVRGHLFDPAGKPLPETAVKAMSGGNLSPETQAVTDTSGAFEMALRAGTWFLIAEGTKEEKLYGVSKVAVQNASLADVKVGMQRRIPIAARIEGPVAPVYVHLVPAGWTIGQLPSARPGADGRLLFEDVIPGRYRVMVQGQIPHYAYLDSIRAGELDVMGRDVELYVGAPPLRIVFRNDPGTVRGTVEHCEAATVILIPQEEYLRSDALTRRSACDRSGHYEVAGLRPGSYYAFAFDRIGAPVGLQDRDFVGAMVPLATRVDVRKGEVTALDLKVTPWPD